MQSWPLDIGINIGFLRQSSDLFEGMSQGSLNPSALDPGSDFESNGISAHIHCSLTLAPPLLTTLTSKVKDSLGKQIE